MVHKHITAAVNLFKSSFGPCDLRSQRDKIFRVKTGRCVTFLLYKRQHNLECKNMRHCQGNGSGAHNLYDQTTKCISTSAFWRQRRASAFESAGGFDRGLSTKCYSHSSLMRAAARYACHCCDSKVRTHAKVKPHEIRALRCERNEPMRRVFFYFIYLERCVYLHVSRSLASQTALAASERKEK